MPLTVRAAAIQAEPKWLDLDAGVNQVVDYITFAAAGNAKLVAFPEVFIPGYPWWIWTDTPAGGMQFAPRYARNSMTRDGEHMTRIAATAAENNIFVVLGFTERSGGSLYMAQAIIDDAGEIVAVRRKLKPTHVERSVFGEGDGSDIRVHDTGIGRLGALNCAEHLQPLTKYAMFHQNEEIHVASWPSFSVYRGGAQALSAEVNNAASLVYAVEGQTFVLAPCGLIGTAGQALFCGDDEHKKQLLQLGGGFTQIYGPEGSVLAKPLDEHEEGVVYADLDFDLIHIAKSAYDPVGHYSRPDVFRLLFNSASNAHVREMAEAGSDGAPPVEGNADSTDPGQLPAFTRWDGRSHAAGS